ncbi:MAG: UbiA family prenyltransferase, partial [candidate division Zixibacteria bacterium]|nr:UbiA family prenyltransferase [candidate division Zixibacteria bacterium]
MLKSFLKLIRPSQWIKNGVVLAGLIFAGKAKTIPLAATAFLTFIAFCALSSAVYIFNDIIDRERDRRHPLKKNRPIATGQISVTAAILISLFMAAIGLLIAAKINGALLIVSISYLILNIFYTLRLKNIVIIDVMTIAAGFVLRALAGAVAIRVEFSGWLLIATFVLALFLGLGKRRHELTLLQADAIAHRKILANYSP